VTELAAVKAVVARHECILLLAMEVAKYFLLILPLRPSHFVSDLLEAYRPTAELIRFVLWNVMVKKDHGVLGPSVCFLNEAPANKR
jgi:hypothetical protein